MSERTATPRWLRKFFPGTAMTIFSASAIVLSAWVWSSNRDAAEPNMLAATG